MGLATEQSQAQCSVVPASAPGHTPQFSCSVQLRPHHPVGFWVLLVAPRGVTPSGTELDSPGHLGFQKGKNWPGWLERVPSLSKATGLVTSPQHPTLSAWGCPSHPSAHLQPPVTSLAPSNCLTIKPPSWKNLPCFFYTNDSIVHTCLYGRTAYTGTYPSSNLFQAAPASLERSPD